MTTLLIDDLSCAERSNVVPLRTPTASHAQAARDAVAAGLTGRCQPSRLAEAMARAERSVRAGLPIGEAVRRAVAWARCVNPEPPEAA